MKKGEKMSEEQKAKISKANMGRPSVSYWLGKKRSKEVIEKFRLAKLGTHRSEETKKKISDTNKRIGKKPEIKYGEEHHNWIKDRTKLKTDRLHAYDTRYKLWMLEVKNRDGWKCKIFNSDCSGRLEAHHILGWKDHPELRYEINNGITLCLAHHPKKRAEEKRLSPFFMELVSVSKK